MPSRRSQLPDHDVDNLPLADLLGPMGDDYKQFEQDLDEGMQSFVQGGSTITTMSSIDEMGGIAKGVVDGGIDEGRRPNLFTQQGESGDTPKGRGQERYRHRRASSPPNSAFEPQLDILDEQNEDLDNTLSTLSSIEIGRSAPAQHLRQSNRRHSNQQQPLPSLRVQSPSYYSSQRIHDDHDHTKHIGASPSSTMGHHVSKLSNGMGPNGWMVQGGGGKGDRGAWDKENTNMGESDGEADGEEYDKDRSVRRLLEELQNADRSSGTGDLDAITAGKGQKKIAPQASQGSKLASASTKPNVFGSNTSSNNMVNNNNAPSYRPLKPSPLKQALHPNPNRTISASSSAGGAAYSTNNGNGNGGGLRAEQAQGLFGSGGSVVDRDGEGDRQGNAGYMYQDTPVPIRGRRSASSSLLVGGGERETSTAKRVGQVGMAPTMLTAGTKEKDVYGSTPSQSQRVRIVSDPGTKARREASYSVDNRNTVSGNTKPNRPVSSTFATHPKSTGVKINGNVAGSVRKSESWENDLTRLTDLCRTPGKGDSFVPVGENAAAPGTGGK